MSVFPSQKLSLKEKLKVDDVTQKHWGHNCVDYLIDNSNWSQDYEEIVRIKRMVDGEINDDDYNHVLNPFNTSIDRYKRFGAQLRDFNILNPVRDLYLGEFGKRFKNIQVFETNPEDESLYKQGLERVIKNYYTQKAINQLNSLGLQTGQEDVDQQTLDEVVGKYKEDFDTNRIIEGQATLDFLKYDKELDELYQNVYGDWIDCGRAFTYKDISFNDVNIEWVPCEELSVPKTGSSDFIEDRGWAVRRRVIPPHELLDKFHDELDEAAKDYLDEILTNDAVGMQGETQSVILPTQYISKNDRYKAPFSSQKEGVVLYHTTWKSWQKVGLLTYMDEFGQIQTMEVDETYKLDKSNGDVSIKWDWISQVWEGFRIDNSEHYFRIRPIPYNRMALNNKSLQKLPYNGRMMLTTDGKVKSIMKTGEPYQIIYNIVKYQFEKIINKNKDKIMVIPQGLIPKGINGWDEEKFMYYSYANSLMVIDETSPTAGLALQGIKVLDASLAGYAKEMIELLAAIKMEWWESIGMNRQRYGDTKASDGKGITEQAIFRSAIISEELNRRFEKLQEKDYAGLLDLSKLAYIKGKKGQYINSDQQVAYLTINPDDALKRLGSEFGVFVRNSGKEQEKLDALKEYAFAYAQNGGSAEMFMSMLDTTNFTKGKAYITHLEQLEKQRQERMENAANEANKEIEKSRAATEQNKLDVEVYKADKDYDKTIDAKLLDLGSNLDDKGSNEADNTKMEEERRMNDHKIEKENKELSISEQDLERKKKETQAKIKQINKPQPVKSN